LDTTVVHGIKSAVFETFLVGCDVTHDDERIVRYCNIAVLH